ncbi:GNAT superfamily N-acetyltransferase [Thermocatellispora tengchongensis]|uniref:GNAT superfamily N-acetyltransferase n=1 Tax=Thermocatellispora tengchongensis TaxID=1073253 RepID=A0A840P554_9ACTN|nr:GNAT family N-acetyltransferase [Thermocatellispora tengchongensis]MBB5133033.1 GNAT superfamily N-acetyltransferase [Thermocatellispora tengchongensis]
MTVTPTPYRGPADLRAMQDLVSRLWSPASRWHIGDLAWGRFQHTGREPEWPTTIWRSGEDVLAWAWIELPDHLNLVVDPAHAGLAGQILTWFTETATAATLTTAVSAAEAHLIEALERHGFTRAPAEEPHFVHMARDLSGDLPEPRVPPGHTLRHVTAQDVPSRVAAHRAAFHPSRVTEESYTAVRAAWPYREELDTIVLAPDGSVAAYCLAWLDEANRSVLIEPAGTTPDHRRKGLATAACLSALHTARDLGAVHATVAPRGDTAYPIPRSLYAAIGFHSITRTAHFTRGR